MDSRSVIGFLLIILLTFVWLWYNQSQMPQRPPVDSTGIEQPAQPDTVRKPEKPSPDLSAAGHGDQPETRLPSPAATSIRSDSTQRVITIESPLLEAQISNRDGGRVTRWILKKFDHYLGGQVDLVFDKAFSTIEQNGLEVEFMDRDGKPVRLSDFTMYSNFTGNSLKLDENAPARELEFYLPIQNGRVVKKYIFYNNKYSFDVIIRFEGLQDYVGPQRWYSVKWENGLPSTEENIAEDYDYARAYAYQNGELNEYDVSKGENKPKFLSGTRTDWTAIRNKYFLAAIIPHQAQELNVALSGYGFEHEKHLIKAYSTSLGINFPSPLSAFHADTFTVYLGPLDYGVVKRYNANLENLVMSKGYEQYLRPISIAILWAFGRLHSLIPNYGLVIIIFSILIKIVLHPLTKKSYQSMSEMQYVQPEMAKLREKYKSDPQRLNREMMKLYKEHGINPLGGCLPTLLQMPLLFALFIVFRSTIQLRGEPFMLWITDLSRPDALFLGGITLPLIGQSIHVLPFLMGATMIWQSKMTMTDPKQKAMVYIMPVFMIFIFYSLPSGLNLYYAVFNLLSMVQTHMIKKKMHPGNGEKGKIAKEPEKALPEKVRASRASKKKK